MSTTVAAVVTTAISLFIMLAAGYVARRFRILSEDSSKVLSKLIICVGQPFMLIDAMLDVEYSPENLKTGFMILGLAVASHIVIALAAFTAAVRMKDIDERKIFEFSVIFANCGFMGFPLLRAMFGDTGTFWGSFYIIAFNIFTWTWGMVLLGRKRSDIKINLKSMILNYGTLPCLIGLALFAFRVPVPDAVAAAVDSIGKICTPISMIITGGLISTTSPKEIFTSPKLYAIAALRLFTAPALVGLIAALCGLSADLVMFLTILAAMPVAANTVMFAELYDIRPKFAAAAVGLTSLLSTATLPLVAAATEAALRIIGRL
jgi:predicted permease